MDDSWVHIPDKDRSNRRKPAGSYPAERFSCAGSDSRSLWRSRPLRQMQSADCGRILRNHCRRPEIFIRGRAGPGIPACLPGQGDRGSDRAHCYGRDRTDAGQGLERRIRSAMSLILRHCGGSGQHDAGCGAGRCGWDCAEIPKACTAPM